MRNKYISVFVLLLFMGVFIEVIPTQAESVPLNDSVVTQIDSDYGYATITFTPVVGADIYKVTLFDERNKEWGYFSDFTTSFTVTGFVATSTKPKVRVEAYKKITDTEADGYWYNNEKYVLVSVSKEYKVTGKEIECVKIYETEATTNSATISWDDKGVDGYYIYKGGYTEGSTPIAETTETKYVIKNLSADDFPNNESERIKQQYSVVPFSKGAGGYVTLGQYVYHESSIVIAISPVPVTELHLDSWSTVNNKMKVTWDFQPFVGGSGDCGYEMEITDLNGKVLKSTDGMYNKINRTATFDLNVNAPVIFRIRPYRIYTSEFLGPYNDGWISIYRDEDKKSKFIGEWRECVCIPNAKITKAKALKKGRVSLKWKKVKGAESYTIYAVVVSPKSKRTYKKVAKVGKNTTTYTVKNYIKKKNAKKYKEYFFIQANNVTVNGKKYSSPYNYNIKTMKLVKMKW